MVTHTHNDAQDPSPSDEPGSTPLRAEHLAAGATMVDFAGWQMPLHYGSQVAEHHAVRGGAGMFDVSHMTVVDVTGGQANDYLRRLLANDVDRLTEPGRALYTAMCNQSGGIVDDLIVYRLDEGYRVVINSATTQTDLAWMTEQAEGFDVVLEPRRDLAMIAVQGPKALVAVGGALGEPHATVIGQLRPFRAAESGELFIGATGYTGEPGVEIMVPAAEAVSVWRALLGADVQPAGLGARDTLRLEAGLNLYGQDMDTDHSPLESAIGWTVAWEPSEREFIGRAALESQRGGDHEVLVGLLLEGRGVLRAGQSVVAVDDGAEPAAAPIGAVTSGTFSPTLGRTIAMARVAADHGETAQVVIRNRRLPVRVVPLPFVKRGVAQY